MRFGRRGRLKPSLDAGRSSPANHTMTKDQLIRQVALAMCNQHSRVPIHEPCGTHLSAAEHLYNLGYLLEVKG